MELGFLNGEIVSARWRYVYTHAVEWFQLGNPTARNPVRSNWSSNALTNNDVRGTGIVGVINTLIHFERLSRNDRYHRFQRGGGAQTTLTVRRVCKVMRL